jgi:hypothetical protein
MSTAIQLPGLWGAGSLRPASQPAVARQQAAPPASAADPRSEIPAQANLEHLRKHTERLLRRYLYASMQIGRAPSVLGEPVSRGWASSRPIKTFEDAVTFVLDIERCLDHLNSLDRGMLCRVVLQEYTHAETAALMGMSVRTIAYKFPLALDRLTEKLVGAGLLVLPQ